MINANQFADANKASMNTLFGLSGQAMQGLEQLVKLNMQVVKTVLAELQEGSQAAMSAKTPEVFIKLQTSALQAIPEKAASYGRQVQQIITDATATQRAAVEAQVAAAQGKFLEVVDGAAKNAPGSEHALALAKSAVAAANNAYEGVNKASKQVTEAIAANVAKVTEAATAATTAANV